MEARSVLRSGIVVVAGLLIGCGGPTDTTAPPPTTPPAATATSTASPTPAASATASPTAPPSPTTQPTATPAATPSATVSSSPPPCTDLEAEPIAWWPGEGTAEDAVGLADGTLAGDATFVPGHVGQAFSFDGAEDSATFAGEVLDVTGDQVTIEAWIRLEESPTDGQNFSGSIGKNDFPDRQSYMITFETGPIGSGVGPTLSPDQWQFEFIITNAAGTRLHDQATSLVLSVDGSFHHFAMTYDGAMVRLFIDGAERYQAAFTGNLLSVPEVPLTFTGGAAFAADEVTIYDVALTPGEIGAIHAAGAGGKCPPG